MAKTSHPTGWQAAPGHLCSGQAAGGSGHLVPSWLWLGLVWRHPGILLLLSATRQAHTCTHTNINSLNSLLYSCTVFVLFLFCLCFSLYFHICLHPYYPTAHTITEM